MAKRRSSGNHYVSKGLHPVVNKSIKKAVRLERRNSQQHSYDLLTAWRKGTNPWITISNPNTKETNKRFIRVRANIVWGNPHYKPKLKVSNK